MPLTTIPWADVNMSMLERTSTMVVRSGILQAYTAVHAVKSALREVGNDAVGQGEEGEGMDVDGGEENDGGELPEQCKQQ